MPATAQGAENSSVISPASDSAHPGSMPDTHLALDRLHQGDCLELFRGVATGSIDLIFADPPFNIGYDYDIYDDRLEAESYLKWSLAWGREVVRVLKPEGSFWLAIGDEYAAELKVQFHRELGLSLRSWVIWYYTFGVHCTKKFTRSHAHLLYFVRDPKRFTFNDAAIRVPSARQLIYFDSRANPKGRVPDDTWILRPQDVPDGFAPEGDTWYIPRVCGTFKERRRLAWLPDARTASGPNHPHMFKSRRNRARSLRRQRHHAGRRQEAGPALSGIRALARLRRGHRSATRSSPSRTTPGRQCRSLDRR